MDESYLKKKFNERIGFDPYKHQVEAMKLLLQGRSVVLRAPCGTGKTEAVLIPFILQILEEGRILPHHLIYSLPMRVLTESLAERTKDKKKLDYQDVVAHHGMNVSDKLFERSLIFTTIDQTIGAYCCVPLSSSLRAGNIPAGAVSSAMLCFDEVHTYDYERALNSMCVILESLKRFDTPFAVLSATLPDRFLEYCEKSLDAERIDVTGSDEELIPCRKTREVKIQKCNRELTERDVKERFYSSGRNAKILVVCNTVKKAQFLYKSLRDVFGVERCFLLHSRFVPEDRKNREEEVLRAFNGSKKCCIITTQVCEVGLDISCDVLLTEVSPIDSLIQRVGRCARRGGKGEVYVFDVKDSKPYEDNLIRATYREVEDLQGKVLRWDMEKECVNKLLSSTYGEALSTTRYGLILNQLIEASFTRNRRKVGEAVREAFTCKFTVNKDPESIKHDVFKLPALSLDVNVLRGFYRKCTPRLWYVDVKKADYEGVYSRDVEISEVRVLADIVPYGFFIAHPDFVYYDEYLGLYLGERGKSLLPSNVKRQPERLTFEYKRETWAHHAERALDNLKRLLHEYSVEIEKFSRALGIKRDQLKAMIALCVALHDIGKLNTEWQKAAGATSAKPLAHTESVRKKLPSHAAISAYSLRELFSKITKDLGIKELGFSCLEAIAHHHYVGTLEVEPYKFVENWERRVEVAVEECCPASVLDIDIGRICPEHGYAKLPSRIPSLDSPIVYAPYTFISRLLRLSDRRSLE
jgi:CRISPR-associated endonuclease/helicase Cas3